MILEINDKNLIGEIQFRFNLTYPYLWIDFYKPSRTNHAGPIKLHPETMLRNVSTMRGSKNINIDGEKSVAQLESDFKELLGLDIKVLRKSGNVWVGTPFTRNWTLQNQNLEGEQIY